MAELVGFDEKEHESKVDSRKKYFAELIDQDKVPAMIDDRTAQELLGVVDDSDLDASFAISELALSRIPNSGIEKTKIVAWRNLSDKIKTAHFFLATAAPKPADATTDQPVEGSDFAVADPTLARGDMHIVEGLGSDPEDRTPLDQDLLNEPLLDLSINTGQIEANVEKYLKDPENDLSGADILNNKGAIEQLLGLGELYTENEIEQTYECVSMYLLKMPAESAEVDRRKEAISDLFWKARTRLKEIIIREDHDYRMAAGVENALTFQLDNPADYYDGRRINEIFWLFGEARLEDLGARYDLTIQAIDKTKSDDPELEGKKSELRKFITEARDRLEWAYDNAVKAMEAHNILLGEEARVSWTFVDSRLKMEKDGYFDEKKPGFLSNMKEVFGLGAKFTIESLQSGYEKARDLIRGQEVPTEEVAEDKESKEGIITKAKEILAKLATKGGKDTEGEESDLQDPKELIEELEEMEDEDETSPGRIEKAKRAFGLGAQFTVEALGAAYQATRDLLRKKEVLTEGEAEEKDKAENLLLKAKNILINLLWRKKDGSERGKEKKAEKKEIEVAIGTVISSSEDDLSFEVIEINGDMAVIKQVGFPNSIERSVSLADIKEYLQQIEDEKEKAAEINEELISDYQEFRKKHNEWIETKVEGKGKVKRMMGTFFRNSSARVAVGMIIGVASNAALGASPVASSAVIGLRAAARTALSAFGFGSGNRARAIGNEQARAMRDLEEGISPDVKRPGEEGFDEEAYNQALVEKYKAIQDPEEKARILSVLVEIADQKGQKIDADAYRTEREASIAAREKLAAAGGTKARFVELREKFSKMSKRDKILMSGVIALTSVGAATVVGIAAGASITTGLGAMAFLKSIGMASGTIAGLATSGTIGMASGALMSNPELTSDYSENSALIEALGQEYFQNGATDELLQEYCQDVDDKIGRATIKGAVLGVVIANAALILSSGAKATGLQAGREVNGNETVPTNVEKTSPPSTEVKAEAGVGSDGIARDENGYPRVKIGLDGKPVTSSSEANQIPSLEEQSRYPRDLQDGVRAVKGGPSHVELFADPPKGGQVVSPEPKLAVEEVPTAGGNRQVAEDAAAVADRKAAAEVSTLLGLKKDAGPTIPESSGPKEWDHTTITNAENKSDDVVHIFEDPKRPGEYHLHNEGAGAAQRFAHEEVKGYLGKHPELGLSKEQIELVEELREAQMKKAGIFDQNTGAVNYDSDHHNSIGNLKMGSEMHNIIEGVKAGDIYVEKSGDMHGLSQDQAASVRGALPPDSEMQELHNPNTSGAGEAGEHLSSQGGPRSESVANEELVKATGDKVPPTWKPGHDFDSYKGGKSITEAGVMDTLKEKQISKDSLNYINRLYKTGLLQPDGVHVSADGKHLLINMPKSGAKDIVWTTEINDKSIFSRLFPGRTSDIKDVLPNVTTTNGNLGNPLDSSGIKTPDAKFAPPITEPEHLTFKAEDQAPASAEPQLPNQEILTPEKTYVAVDDPNQNIPSADANAGHGPEIAGNHDIVLTSEALQNVDSSHSYLVNLQGREPISVPGSTMGQLVLDAKKYFTEHHAVFKSTAHEYESIKLYVLDRLKTVK